MARSIVWPATAAALVLALGARPARADHENEVLGYFALATVVPSELGAEVTTGEAGRSMAPVIGWAVQWPFDVLSFHARHRMAFELDWTPGGPGVDVRARAGYRHARGPLELGLGLSTGPDRLRLSPEVGLRVWRFESDAGIHLRLRAEPALAHPRDVRGVLTVGWSIM
jgi:hypothetical protein